MDTLACFSAVFEKGRNNYYDFLFASGSEIGSNSKGKTLLQVLIGIVLVSVDKLL